MITYILRGLFILLATSVTALYVLPFQAEQEVSVLNVMMLIGGTLILCVGVIALDAAYPEKDLSAVSGVFLGIIAGLLATYAASFLVDLIPVLIEFKEPEAIERLLRGVKVLLGVVFCYVGISLVLQTKDDFRFIIPYVEFAKELRGSRPTLLDTSVIVDGRIVDIIETHALQGPLVVPRFVLNELQTIADASEKMKRARGRRGLDMLQSLQESHAIEVQIEDRDAEGAGVDQKLISLAQHLRARVMTNDYNLNKIAQLRGVEVINLNDLAKALRPVALPGEELVVKLVKPGENPSQGVGYLDDGTMVVVENGREHIGERVDLVVTSTLQTSAGRMIFGKFASTEDEEEAEEAVTEPVAVAEEGHRVRTTRRNPRRG
ncbi:PIN/TRAM domain-containing protein [Mucisphaera calidilacus]|uniref:Putative PIN and TRAM-domain containing protein n=1 Tax=Mucisphaera calidilacus TaxID=2527982 RepID=A0A518BXY0_9BACT|nr:TRAM domain-containing protein [Mucisphaera calidilacus]QDU71839.1 putative PIN and TRAM-domain containing protein precursor [Mucisphaera calidilacus]